MAIRKDKIAAVRGLQEYLDRMNKNDQEETPTGGSSSTSKASDSTSVGTTAKKVRVKDSAIDAVPGLRQQMERRASKTTTSTTNNSATSTRRSYGEVSRELDELKTRRKELTRETSRIMNAYTMGNSARLDELNAEYKKVRDRIKELNKELKVLDKDETRPVYTNETASQKMDAVTNAEKALTQERGSGTDIGTEIKRLGDNLTNLESGVQKMADAYKINPTEENYNKYLAVYDEYQRAATDYAARYGEYEGLVDSYNSAYEDYNYYMDNARSDASGWEIAGNAAAAGLGAAAKGFGSTLDFIIPAELWGEKDPLSKFIKSQAEEAQYFQDKWQESIYGRSGFVKTGSEAVEATAAALPNAILALMSGGSSVAAQGSAAALQAYNGGMGIAAGTGLASTLGTVANNLVRNPMYWSSAAQMLGPTYEEMKAKGANEWQASAVAIISTALNAGVEVSGGIETLPAKLQGGDTNAILQWVLSTPEEGIEEVVQRLVSGSTEKLIYDHDKAIYDEYDPEAIINPKEMGKEFAMGTAVGGILGGAQVAGVSALNAVANKRLSNIGSEFTNMGDDVVQAVIEEGLESAEGTESHELAVEAKKKLDAGEALTDREIGQLYQANVRAIETEQRLAVQNRDDSEAKTQPVSEASEKTTIIPLAQKRSGTAQNIAATYGEKGAQAFMKMFENSDITVEEAVKSFQSPYEMGRTNKLGAAANQLTGIQKIAYNAGRVDAIADLGRRKLQNPVVHDVAGFDWTNAPADVTESDKAFAQLLSKAYAVKGVWGESTDSEAFDGKINSEGIVTLAKDFGISESALKVIGGVANLNKIKNIAKVRNKSMTFLLAHEIAVHRMMQLAPEEGLAFVNSLYNALGKGRPEYASTLAEGMQARYDKQGVKLETGKAIEEIAADAIIELYGGEQKFVEAMERIINGKDEKAKSGMRKYIDMLKDTVEKLKRLFNRLRGKENAEARAEVKSAIAENEKLIELFENAQRAALKKVETVGTQEYTGNMETEDQYSTKDRRAQRGRSIEMETMENNRFERLRQFGENLPSEWYAYTGGYFYVYSNHSFMDYTVLAKAKITEKNRADIDRFMEDLENGTYEGAETFSSWTSAFRRGKGRDSWHRVGTTRTGTAGRNDGVDVRERGSKHSGNFEENSGVGEVEQFSLEDSSDVTVYHGSNAEFDEFDFSKLKDELGVFFAAEKSSAESWGNAKAYTLKPKKTLVVHQGEEYRRLMLTGETDAEKRKRFIKEGYDTVKIVYNNPGGGETVDWIALKPDVIHKNDVQFSLKDQENLLKENAKLKETVDGLKSQFKTTEFAKVDKNKLYSFAKTLLKDYESGADITETRDGLDDLYTYIANGEDGNPASWNEVQRRAYGVAVHILEGASVLNDEMYQNYKDIRDRLRTRGVSIDKRYDSSIPGYESINAFRKANFGKLRISNDATPVDIVYQDLANTYPELFDEYEYTTQADQIAHIADVLDSLQPYEVNPYEYNMRESATWLANDIIERFYELPQAKPTFADRAETKLTKQVIKDTKKLEALRDKKNERIAKLIAENRERVNKARAKERDKRAEAVKELKEHYKAKESKASESRKTRELRAKIVRHVEQMDKRLMRGTDKVNVPEMLKPAVAELLSCINLESNYSYDPATGSYKKNDDGLPTRRTEAFRELKKQYEAIAANNDIGMVISPELLGVPAEGIKSMLDIVASYKDIRLVDMNLSQLQTVYDVIRVIEHSILMAGKMLSKTRWETIDKAADAFMHDTKSRKTKRSLTEKHRMLDIETPYTFFSHFGEAGHGFYRMLREAQDREQVMQDELTSKLAEIASLEDRQKSEKDIVEFTTQRGDKLTLSKAHIMNIYLLNKRKQAVGHLLGGGIVQPKIGKVRKGTEAVLLTEMDLANLFEHIKEEREIADGLQKLTLLMEEWGNDASMTVYGIKKFNDPNYWTIHSSDIGFNQNVEQGSNKPRSIANMGSAKSVIPEASNPLEIDSVFEVFDRHASDMLCYSAWLAPMEDANRLFNYKYRDENWIPTGKTVKGIINRASGEGSTQYWMRLMEDIQNGLSAPADTATEQDVMKTIGKVKKAAVSGNIRVIVQQPTAYARAAAVLDPDVMLASVAKGAAIKPTLDGWAKAIKYAPIAARKAAGGYEVSSNPKQLSELMYLPESKIGKLKQGAKEAPLWAAGKADELTWGTIWNACEMQVSRDNKSLKKGTDEFYETVKVLFTEVIDQTQVVDGVLQRSQAMRSGSNFVKQMTAFTGEPTQGANMVIRAYDQLRYESDPKKRGKALKKLSRAVAVYTFTAVLNAFAQSLVDGLRDDDDEKEYWEKVWAAFHGINGNEETWKDYARNIILGSNVINNMNPMSWIPVWKDVLSIIQGYSVERMDAASMGDFFDSISNVAKSYSGEGKYTTGYAALKAIVAADKLRGGSSYNILRDIEGIVRTFQVETDDYMARYNTMKLMTKPTNNLTSYAKLLYDAYENDSASYKQMYNDLINSGVEADDIRVKMEGLMKKAQGVDKVEDLEQRYLSPDHQSEYDAKMASIKKSGLWSNADEEHRDSVEDKLYGLVTDSDSSDGLQEKIDAARDYGMSETDYLLYTLALEMYDTPNKSGEYGGAPTNEEKATAIAAMGRLTDEAIAYLWDTEEAYELLDAGIDMSSYVERVGAGHSVNAEKLIDLHDDGVAEETYYDFLDMLKEVDQPTKSGKLGSYTQAEATAAIRAMPGLTNKERALLWQSVNKSWKASKNPWG